MGQEQRQFDRVPQAFMVRCRPLGSLAAIWQTMLTLDVSAGGIFLKGEMMADAGEMLEIELPIPGNQAQMLRGRVVRAKELGPGTFEYAVEFVEVSPDQQADIDELVQFLKQGPRGA